MSFLTGISDRFKVLRLQKTMANDLAKELDNILLLSIRGGDEIWKNTRLIYASKKQTDKLQLLVEILKADGFLNENTAFNTAAAPTLTPLGTKFILLEGYQSRRRKEFRAAVWNAVKISVGVLNAVALIYLGYVQAFKSC
jgi:predicted transcriptional regulator